MDRLQRTSTVVALLQMYGRALTKKQYAYLEEYYFNDMTYSEIAKKYAVSRNAAMLMNKRSFKQLLNLENRLGFIRKSLQVEGAAADRKITPKEVKEILWGE